MRLEQRLNALLSTLFRFTEKLVLTGVGVLALMGIAQLVWAISEHREVRLEDLLLMFIYIEIMAMTHVYFVRHAVPFTYPMFIAVTALSRLIVLQGKNIAPENLLYEGGAILLVSIAILIVRYSQRYSIDAAGEATRHEPEPTEHR
ncbi:phosphate-starvation-inducible protein PsiE [Marichromatium gracile]|uniref:Protein PsiE n=1 Tax=Marichromatium gracile TaxID=1048 RepID=A0ABR5VDV7_MARGR|nr:phosphate-starvation-inducible PsiE family protein [Marichromatium gracile]KXX63900.1 phosphate-starvation-inducible E [Marichromatium gracile]